jgi:hypothetical protein
MLDAVVPAFAGTADAPLKSPQRLAIVNTPNGMIMEKWTPATEGADFQLSPILEPLAPVRDRLLVLSGLAQNEGRARPGENGGEHPRATGAYLTCAHTKETAGADIQVGVSMDQVLARELGKQTPWPSLELGLESSDYLGACESNYSCAYYNTLSWRNSTTPMPVENNPRVIFERLYGAGNGTDPAARLARIGRNRSILDFVTNSTARLLGKLGPDDRGKINQYLDAVRDVERRIQVSEEQSSSRELPSLQRPTGVPETFEDHLKLMFDLQALAFQGDITRITTLMYGHEMGALSYPQLGAPDGFHAYTHHQGDPFKIAKTVEIDTYNVKMFFHFLDQLRSTPDGDGSLLDHSMILYGASLGDGNLHMHNDLPVLLVTGGAGQIQGGRHLRYPQNTPMANLYLALMEKFGVSLDRFGDSTGKLEL